MVYYCCYCKEQLIEKGRSSSWDPTYYECPNCGAKAMHDNNADFEYSPPELEFIKRPSNKNYKIK